MAEVYRFTGRKLTKEERKERMNTTRHSMSEQHPEVRMINFEEVNLGYDAETAIKEAKRCLLCTNAPCAKGCPVKVKVPEFLEKIAEGDFLGALDVVIADNTLPAITGRVCPQEIQCEGPCTQGKVSEQPVGIGYLERFVADYERQSMKCIFLKRCTSPAVYWPMVSRSSGCPRKLSPTKSIVSLTWVCTSIPIMS